MVTLFQVTDICIFTDFRLKLDLIKTEYKIIIDILCLSLDQVVLITKISFLNGRDIKLLQVIFDIIFYIILSICQKTLYMITIFQMLLGQLLEQIEVRNPRTKNIFPLELNSEIQISMV